MSFKYNGLSSSGSDVLFRVVELVSDDPPALKVKIHTFPLDDAPAYDALSYCWGSDARNENISVEHLEDGSIRTLLVTENLLKGLRQIFANKNGRGRRGDILYSRFLWVDAICINQSDHREKESQVPLMWKIYSNAKKTITWLGQPRIAGEDSLCYELMCVQDDFYLRSIGEKSPQATITVSRGLRSWFMQRRHRDSLAAFTSLLSNPWFTRAWVIQEIAVAVNVVVLYGAISIPWSSIVRCSKMCKKLMLTNTMDDEISRLERLDAVRSNSRKKSSSTFFELLTNLAPMKSTLDRDLIYSLMSLASDSRNLAVRPDYDPETTDAEIYSEFASRMILRYNDLRLLGVEKATEHGNAEGSPKLELPSWVPDWRVRTIESSMAEKSSKMAFKAGGDGKPWYVVEGHQRLRLRGVCLSIPENMWRCDKESYDIDTVNRMLDEARAQPRGSYFTGEDVIDVFWQCILRGVPKNEYKKFRNSFHLFEDLRVLGDKYEDVSGYTGVAKLILETSALFLWQWKQFFFTGISESFASTNLLKTGMLVWSSCDTLSLVPLTTKPGDRIFFAQGCRFPTVVRSQGSKRFKLIGPAYTHGFMNGEIWKTEKSHPVKEITLV